MKKQPFILSVVTGMFIMISCSHGPSEEAKKKVASFDSDWSDLGATAKAWGDSLNKESAMCEGACKAGEAIECCEHTKAAKDSLMMPCKNDMALFHDMKKNWDAQMPMMDSLNAIFIALKEKVSSGKANDAEINIVLGELQTAIDFGSKGLLDWMSKFKDAKMTCIKNMESCKMGWANVKCMDKKCPIGKKMMETEKKKS